MCLNVAFTYDLRFPGQIGGGAWGSTFQNEQRDYDSAVGGYIESDPMGLRGGSFSTYTYAADDPIGNFDPTGRDAWTYYTDYINLINFISNVNADVFGFVSAEGSVPTGSPVRAAAGVTGLAGYETQSGAYVAGIPAVGTLYGGSDIYYGSSCWNRCGRRTSS